MIVLIIRFTVFSAPAPDFFIIYLCFNKTINDFYWFPQVWALPGAENLRTKEYEVLECKPVSDRIFQLWNILFYSAESDSPVGGTPG